MKLIKELRIKKREQKVPEKVILSLLEKSEPPTVIEGHEVRVVV